MFNGTPKSGLAALLGRLKLLPVIFLAIMGPGMPGGAMAQTDGKPSQADTAAYLRDLAQLAPEMQTTVTSHLAQYGTESFASFLRFDLNHDAKVDHKDAALLGATPYQPGLDMDGSGGLDDADVWWLELLVGDGTNPGWGFLDFDNDGAVSAADYEIPAQDAGQLAVFERSRTAGWQIVRRPVSGVSLAFLFGFGGVEKPWETVLRSAGLVLRPMNEAETARVKGAPEMAGFAGKVFWVVDAGESGLGQKSVPLREIRLVRDQNTGIDRILFSPAGAARPDPADFVLTPGFVLGVGSGRIVRVLEPDNGYIRKGSLETGQSDFASILRYLDSTLAAPAHAAPVPSSRLIFIGHLNELETEINLDQDLLETEVARIVSMLGKLEQQAAGQPCKRLDCEQARAAFVELLHAEGMVREAARRARIMALRFDRQWDNERATRSALMDGYYKQDVIRTYQKGLIAVSDILAMDFSKVSGVIDSLIANQGVGPVTELALKKLGLPRIGGIATAGLIAGTTTSGVQINTAALTNKRFKLVRNGWAQDARRLKKAYALYGKAGLARGLARSPHIAGFLRGLLKPYANKKLREVEARRDQALKFADQAALGMLGAEAARLAAKRFARNMSFTAQRIDGLRQSLKGAILSCLDAGKAKDCQKAHDKRVQQIEADEGRAQRAADNLLKTTKAAKTKAESAYEKAFNAAGEAHRKLVAARNGSTANIADIQQRLNAKKRLLQTADQRLGSIRSQERQLGIDLGASRLGWAQAKLDAKTAIDRLSTRLAALKGQQTATPEDLAKTRAQAWKKVDSLRRSLPGLRRAFHKAQGEAEKAGRAYADALNKAKSDLADCIARGFVGRNVARTADKIKKAKAQDLFYAKDIGGPALKGLSAALGKLAAIRPELTEIEGCEDQASAPPADAGNTATSDPDTWDDPAGVLGDWQYVGGIIRLTATGKVITGTWVSLGDFFEMFNYTVGGEMLRAHLENGVLVGKYYDRIYPEDAPIEACPDMFNQWVDIRLEPDQGGRNFLGYMTVPIVGYEPLVDELVCKYVFDERRFAVFSRLSRPDTGSGETGDFNGLWKGYYGSTVRVTESAGKVRAVFEKVAEQIRAAGFSDGSVLFEGQLSDGRLNGQTYIPLDWNPKCAGKTIAPKIRGAVSGDGAEMNLSIEAFAMNGACGMDLIGGWRDAVYTRLE